MRRRHVLRKLAAGGVSLGVASTLAGCLPGSSDDASTTAVSDWLTESDATKGITDRTGRESTTVDVGVDDGLAFGPPAIEIDEGTTVVWRWTGKGGRHNVVDRDGAFESSYHEDEGATFDHEFPSAGQFLYYCEPHRELGMRGAVVVR